MLYGARKQQSLSTELRKSPSRFLALALYLSFFSLIARDACGGALRYYTDIYSLKILWYLPDLLTFGTLGLTFFKRFAAGKSRDVLVIGLLWLSFSILGLIATQSLMSVWSAAKMIQPLLLGLCLGDEKDAVLSSTKTLFVLFCVSVLGVLWSESHAVPWLNYATSDFGVQRTAAAQTWFIDGIVRLTGFAARNSAAASITMVLAILLMRNVPLFVGALFAVVALYIIYLTTSRAPAVALLVFCAAWIFLRLKKDGAVRKLYWTTAGALFASVFLFPLLGLWLYGLNVPPWATSFVERIQSTWVKPYSFLAEEAPWSFLLGAGLGSVGYPVTFSNWADSPLVFTDNFLLMNFLMFGVFGLASLFLLIKRAAKALAPSYLCLLLTLLAYGISSQIYGGGGPLLLIGLLLSWRNVRPSL